MSSDNRDRPIMSRRAVIGTGLAAAGALALGRGVRSTQAATSTTIETETPPRPYGPFKMGLQSYSLRGYTVDGKPDLDRALRVTKELGVPYWEAYTAHIPIDPQRVAEDRKRAADAGVTVIGFGVLPFGKNAAADRRAFEFARALGVKYMSADPEPGSFDGLDKLVEEFGVAIGIHNHGPGHRWAKIDTIAEAIKGHHPKIGCCVDTGHFLRSREDPVRAVEVFGTRVYGVHLKDVKDATTFTVLGKGDLRTTDLLKALAKNHYQDCLALEYEENPEDPKADIEACLNATRKAIAEAIGGP